MIYTEMTKKAMKLAYEMHEGQKDRSGIPYIFHPIHLAEQMVDEDSTIVALLHDIVEDTSMTFDKLLDLGFTSEIVDAIQLLTKPEEEVYLDYVSRVKQNELARKVKLADLTHNMDLTRLDQPSQKDYERKNKYLKAMELLINK